VGLKDYAGAVWGLTGTLIPNHLGEAWTHLYAAGATTRRYVPFQQRYCEGYESAYGWKPTGVREEHLEEYLAMLRPLSLRRRLRDIWKDLPPVSWNVVPLEGADRAIRELHRLERELRLDKLSAALRQAPPEELDALLRDADVNTSEYQRLVSEAKRPLVLEEIKLLLDGGVDKLVVFAWFRDTVDYLTEHLTADYGAVKLYGGTTDKNRDAAVARFQTDPTCRVIVGNVKSMGTAVALHAARHALFADSSWSMGDTVQAAKRIITPDQTEPFELIVCSLAGTTDDAVAQSHARKAEQAGVLNAI
jgi:SNF2 family DNA or RNA helicase